MSAAICNNGINAVVPLSNRIVYGRSVRSSLEDGEASRGKGISMTVPERKMPETGSKHSTHVPGGYFLCIESCHHGGG